ncbi:MAG: CHAT domain-containing protein [Phaeodactylibacter sp.]|nr:CHAT domain-containing protein [Phaeodactylibacter sp.]
MLNTKIMLAICCLFFAAVSGNGQESCEELIREAETLFSKGQFEEARKAAVKAIEICGQTPGKKTVQYADALTEMGAAQLFLGNFPEALDLFSNARSIMKETAGDTLPEYGAILSNLGMAYIQMGLYDKALEPINTALGIAEKTKGKNDIKYSIRKNSLGIYYLLTGQYDQAISIIREVLPLVENKLGKKDFQYGSALGNLAFAYDLSGQVDSALINYLNALSIIEKAVGTAHPNYLALINNYIRLCLKLGQYEQGEALIQEALEQTAAKYGRDNIFYARLEAALGVFYQMQGSYEKAISHAAACLPTLEKYLPKTHPDYLTVLNNQAVCHTKLGSYLEAESILISIIKIAEESPVGEIPSFFLYYNNLASLYLQTGRLARADSIISTVIEKAGKVLDPINQEYITYLINGAAIKKKRGLLQESLNLYRQALENLNHKIERSFEVLTEKEKTSLLEASALFFDHYNSFVAGHYEKMPGCQAIGYDNLLALKALLLENLSKTLKAIRQSEDQEIQSLYAEWRNVKQNLYFLYNLPVHKRYYSVDSLEEISNGLERTLTMRSSIFQAAQSKITWKEVAAALHPNEAAIEFIHFRHYRDNEPTDSVLYAAYINKKGLAEPIFVPLFEQKRLERWLSYSGTSTQDQVEEWYDSDTLYQLIWKPLEPYLHGANAIYYSPSGLLHRLAFAAIRKGPDTRLSDDYQLQYVTSSREIPRKSETTVEGLATALVYGGIRYETDREAIRDMAPQRGAPKPYSPTPAGRGGEGQERFSLGFLEFTIPEMESVARILKANQVFTMTLQGYEGLEESFKALGEKYPSPQIIHIPTHGFFFEPFANQDRPAANSFESAKDALLRCGLLLAGADTTWRGHPPLPGCEDGILTGYEIANLDLSDTRLTVLSACNTGRGEIKGGEGVYGLQRAFKLAGAEWIIMTLWNIQDGPQTVDFMAAFYKNWFSGMDIRAAFHKAQREMKELYKAPYYWAPFVLIR